MESHFATLNGQRFHYLSKGSKTAPTLLMLHGFPEYSGGWKELTAQLPAFHCVAPDQRGFGQSWAPQDVSDYATGKLAGDAAALIEHLGGGPVILLGHDWGASVAYALAMSRPNLISRLIIMNGVHPVPFQSAIASGGPQCAASQYINWLRRDGSEDILAANDFEKLLSLFSANMDLSWLSGDTLDAYKAEWSRPGRMRAMVHWYRASPLVVGKPGKPLTNLPDFPVERMKITMPHLLIWGENDTALLSDATHGLEEFAPDLTRVTLPGADHWLHHQQPTKVADAIKTWLAANP